MLVITDPGAVAGIPHAGIRDLIGRRFEQLGQISPDSSGGCFVVFEVGDDVAELDRLTGWPLLEDPFEHVPFGHSLFAPSFDYLEESHACYEIHWDTAGDGFGITAFIPKGETGIDPRVLALCQTYAQPRVEGQ